MKIWDWVRIIAKVLELVAGEMGKKDAISEASHMFGVSETEIRKHGGF